MSNEPCPRCGSTDTVEIPHALHGAGLYCAQCRRWLKWLGKPKQKITWAAPDERPPLPEKEEA